MDAIETELTRQLVKTIRADPEFQRINAALDQEFIALINSTPLEITPNALPNRRSGLVPPQCGESFG